MRRIDRVTRAAAVAGLVLGLTGAAQAQSPEAFYSENDVTLLVSAPAGTLTDIVAREFADYYGRHIPGEPDIIVMNMPGAGGMVAAADLQLSQPADGSVVGFLQRNNLYRPLVEDDHSNFDPREVTWIGSLDKIAYTIVAMARAGVDSADELLEERLILGATGYANENRTLPALLNEYMGTQFEIIHGYSGRGEVYLAMERREVDGWASTVAGLARAEQAQQVEDGTLEVLLHVGWDSPAPFEEVPNLAPYITDPEAKELIDFFILPFQAGRPMAVPGDVPADRVEALRAAFDATISDPDFIDAMQARDYPFEAISGAEVEEVRDRLYAASPELLSKVREILTPPN